MNHVIAALSAETLLAIPPTRTGTAVYWRPGAGQTGISGAGVDLASGSLSRCRNPCGISAPQPAVRRGGAEAARAASGRRPGLLTLRATDGAPINVATAANGNSNWANCSSGSRSWPIWWIRSIPTCSRTRSTPSTALPCADARMAAEISPTCRRSSARFETGEGLGAGAAKNPGFAAAARRARPLQRSAGRPPCRLDHQLAAQSGLLSRITPGWPTTPSGRYLVHLAATSTAAPCSAAGGTRSGRGKRCGRRRR